MTDEHTKHPHYAAAMAAVEKMKAAGWNGVLEYSFDRRFWSCMVFPHAVELPNQSKIFWNGDPYLAVRCAVWSSLFPCEYASLIGRGPDERLYPALEQMRAFGLDRETPPEEVKPEFELGGEGG